MRLGLLLGGGLFVLGLLSLFVGVIPLQPVDLLRDPAAWELLRDSRVPRTLAVVITGGALAVCGALLQSMVRNRFVEPMTTGTGQGAALGILFATWAAPEAGLLTKMAVASTTALLASVGFLLIIQRLPPTQPLLIPLVGLIYGGVLGAGVTFIAYQGDLIQYIDVWMNGEFSGVLRGRYELLWVAAFVAVLTYMAADQFAILGLGRTASINLGLNYEQVMIVGLLAISVVTALVVVTVGAIPFLGLVVPNIVARYAGDNLRRTLPLIASGGAALVLASDVIGRLLRHPFEIPVGTVMGILGAVIFLWLLYRPRSHAL
ncbi:iron chelate uptake ABC transporter family permease subunit [Tateyamaria omphalii]|uniref:ABC transporter permease n=1 Tax=Tateyamaria omphalii TaxID=299262 RepID=UPI001C999980|nr:iron chelate uptake ABC transporter family permease subunit [Tateyamaria omphalii]MBY5934962.1 iron chelate uptake ABC transporter family permease subunit [Tateyamaria omphalii]